MAEIMREIPQDDLKASEKDSATSIHGYNAAVSEPNPALDRRILWRRDLVLVPTMGILYMILFLDRTNIANARILGLGLPNGLEMSLNMPSNGYNTALWIFYIPFVLAEIPANLLLSRRFIRPGLLLGGQMFILGIISMCQGLTGSFGGLLACRFLMGIFEVALPAGATFMMSTYYTKREAAVRFAWFFNFALAGPFFSGLLAYAIAGLEGAGGLHGWRWIFIIEGILTSVLAVGVILACPNFPEDAQEWFLKPHERERLVYQLEQSRGAEVRGSAIDSVPLWKVLVDWRIHLFTMCFFCCDITAASISAFSPTILTEMGWVSNYAQLMTMPIWASGIVSAFLFTWLASFLNRRTPFVLFCIVLQLGGWIIMRVYVSSVGVRYFALFLMSMGTFPQMPTLMGWLSANLRGHKYLAVGMAWMIGFGNCANFISSNVFITTERPRYPTGFSVGLGFTVLGFVLICLAWFLCMYKNKQFEKRRENMTDAERERDDEIHFKLVY